MRLAILAVGLFRNGAEKSLYEAYTQRLPWNVALHEVRPSQEPDRQRALTQEGAAMTRHIKPGDRLIALNMDGALLDSAGFSQLLQKEQSHATGRVVFAIGGAEGICPTILARASTTVAFGRLTWPHMLMRPLLAEQLYRAWCIQNRHPYHRD